MTASVAPPRASHGLPPTVLATEPLPLAVALEMSFESEEAGGVEAVELRIELLLPVFGQAEPLETEGELEPEPVGFTLEQARLGTIAGIIETAAAVPVLVPVLATLPVVVVAPEGVVATVLSAAETAGAT